MLSIIHKVFHASPQISDANESIADGYPEISKSSTDTDTTIDTGRTNLECMLRRQTIEERRKREIARIESEEYDGCPVITPSTVMLVEEYTSTREGQMAMKRDYPLDYIPGRKNTFIEVITRADNRAEAYTKFFKHEYSYSLVPEAARRPIIDVLNDFVDWSGPLEPAVSLVWAATLYTLQEIIVSTEEWGHAFIQLIIHWIASEDAIHPLRGPHVLPYPWQILFQFAASPFMGKLDLLHGYIMCFLISIVTFVLVWLFFLLFRFSYNPTKKLIVRIKQIQHNSFLEFIWTVIPFAILLVIFSSSAALIYDGANKTHIRDTIKVIGNQWYWNYSRAFLNFPGRDPMASCNTLIVENYIESFDSYISDARYLRICGLPDQDSKVFFYHPFYLLKSDSPLFIPVREWLRFLISSNDVIHSWALPVAGIKCDAVPGRINEVISLISVSGQYFGQCSELCGINHGFMPIHVWAYNS